MITRSEHAALGLQFSWSLFISKFSLEEENKKMHQWILYR